MACTGFVAWAPGSIPALAGERFVPHPVKYFQKVYPRACGGTQRDSTNRILGRGLSPRLRGNAVPAVPATTELGSIPALAGERDAKGWYFELAEVYPRACGGTFDLDDSALLDRFITRVYPRACGGTRDMSLAERTFWGLSPRLRGNASISPTYVSSRGSIPALAGERKKAAGLSPRLRGNDVATGERSQS